MMASLYGRIDAIESFAADVSHELKNPLTSLRSAVETLPLVKREEQREQLLAIIHHDVQRLDRLISDISDASRLDAELVREDAQPLDFAELVRNFVETYTNMAESTGRTSAKISLSIEQADQPRRRASPAAKWTVQGHQGRLGQVIANLIDNASSFVPDPGGVIDIALSSDERSVMLTVTDNGPGIPAENTERIFQRFYTDRPEGEAFGQNSGLGLSITRQIVEAHGGTIVATNRKDGSGAAFTVPLPRAPGSVLAA